MFQNSDPEFCLLYCVLFSILFCIGRNKDFEALQIVHLYIGTPTYDIVDRDVKITFTTFISLVGGYMGLFTGFSILSGVEILYFLAKFFFSLRLNKTEYQKKAENHLM